MNKNSVLVTIVGCLMWGSLLHAANNNNCIITSTTYDCLTQASVSLTVPSLSASCVGNSVSASTSTNWTPATKRTTVTYNNCATAYTTTTYCPTLSNYRWFSWSQASNWS